MAARRSKPTPQQHQVVLQAFLDTAGSQIPSNMHKNLRLIRELDECSADLGWRLLKHLHAAPPRPGSSTTASSPAHRQAGSHVDAASELHVQLCDAKVSLAMQTYDLVDNHIRRLDQDLKRFEAELKAAGAGLDVSLSGGLAGNGEGREHGRGFAEMAYHVATDVELPIDPSEPVYCICRQVAFGQMIACDDPDCLFEWFHYQCVGLTPSTRPKPGSQWFCADCTARRGSAKSR